MNKRDRAIAKLIVSIGLVIIALVVGLYSYSNLLIWERENRIVLSEGVADLFLIVGAAALSWGLLCGYAIRSAIEALRKS